jgi:hypothetical protein
MRLMMCHAMLCFALLQVSSLVAEVESKQAQLQALEAEHEALTAKARALDQLVASAGAEPSAVTWGLSISKPVMLLRMGLVCLWRASQLQLPSMSGQH